MARFYSFSIMVALFLASVTAIMVSPGFADDVAPEPATGLSDYFDDCLDKLTPECGEEIFTSIFENGPYTDDCCVKLVLMGKPCHDTMLKALLLLPEFKAKASQALLKSEQVWNACVSIAATLPPTPSSSS